MCWVALLRAKQGTSTDQPAYEGGNPIQKQLRNFVSLRSYCPERHQLFGSHLEEGVSTKWVQATSPDQAIFCEVIIFTIRRRPQSWTANEEIRPVLLLMRRRLDQDTWLEGCGLIQKIEIKGNNPQYYKSILQII